MHRLNKIRRHCFTLFTHFTSSTCGCTGGYSCTSISYHSYLSLYTLFSAAESRRAIMEIEYNKSFNFKPPQNGHQVMFTCLPRPRGESAIHYGEIGAQISLALFSGRSISWTCCDEMRAAPASQSLMPNVNSRSLLSPTPCFTSCVIPEIY